MIFIGRALNTLQYIAGHPNLKRKIIKKTSEIFLQITYINQWADHGDDDDVVGETRKLRKMFKKPQFSDLCLASYELGRI